MTRMTFVILNIKLYYNVVTTLTAVTSCQQLLQLLQLKPAVHWHGETMIRPGSDKNIQLLALSPISAAQPLAHHHLFLLWSPAQCSTGSGSVSSLLLLLLLLLVLIIFEIFIAEERRSKTSPISPTDQVVQAIFQKLKRPMKKFRVLVLTASSVELSFSFQSHF